jgi:hypothetical protein
MVSLTGIRIQCGLADVEFQFPPPSSSAMRNLHAGASAAELYDVADGLAGTRFAATSTTDRIFIFNLCTAGSLEERILRLLHEKIRMFELVVGEVGSILGNLEGGDEFESLVFNLWLQSSGPADLDRAFEQLGDSLLAAQEGYLQTKQLDEALFGDEYE